MPVAMKKEVRSGMGMETQEEKPRSIRTLPKAEQPAAEGESQSSPTTPGPTQPGQ